MRNFKFFCLRYKQSNETGKCLIKSANNNNNNNNGNNINSPYPYDSPDPRTSPSLCDESSNLKIQVDFKSTLGTTETDDNERALSKLEWLQSSTEKESEANLSTSSSSWVDILIEEEYAITSETSNNVPEINLGIILKKPDHVQTTTTDTDERALSNLQWIPSTTEDEPLCLKSISIRNDITSSVQSSVLPASTSATTTPPPQYGNNGNYSSATIEHSPILEETDTSRNKSGININYWNEKSSEFETDILENIPKTHATKIKVEEELLVDGTFNIEERFQNLVARFDSKAFPSSQENISSTIPLNNNQFTSSLAPESQFHKHLSALFAEGKRLKRPISPYSTVSGIKENSLVDLQIREQELKAYNASLEVYIASITARYHEVHTLKKDFKKFYDELTKSTENVAVKCLVLGKILQSKKKVKKQIIEHKRQEIKQIQKLKNNNKEQELRFTWAYQMLKIKNKENDEVWKPNKLEVFDAKLLQSLVAIYKQKANYHHHPLTPNILPLLEEPKHPKTAISSIHRHFDLHSDFPDFPCTK